MRDLKRMFHKGKHSEQLDRLIIVGKANLDMNDHAVFRETWVDEGARTHTPRLSTSHEEHPQTKGNPGKGILFKKGEGMTLEAYTDADYAGSLVDRRSTSGYCTFLGGNLVTWRSKVWWRDQVRNQSLGQWH